MIFMIRSKKTLFLILVFRVIFLQAQDTTSLQLLPVEIRAERSYTPSKISLSRSHFLSSPASFDDPSRLLMKYPGFSVSNDQNNAIIYDGLPSHYSRWSLYGAQIANPNHLSDAGTANDRPSRSAGGVNMFSGQIIGGLDYHTGTDGPAHGIGGVADMSIRSPYQNSVTANISLIGLETGIDRVFNDGNSSLMANYRYSTVGLLGQLGVDFGGDIITYQDVMAEYKTKWKGQELRWMAAYGNSNNDHEAQEVVVGEEMEFKDIQDIQLDAENISTAFTLNGEDYKVTLAYSSRDESKLSKFNWDGDDEMVLSEIKEKITSFYGYKKWKYKSIGLKGSLNASYVDQYIVDVSSKHFDPSSLPFGRFIYFEENYIELRPRLTLEWNINNNHSFSLGSNYYSQSLNNEKHILPFLSYVGSLNSINTSLSIQNNRESVAPEIVGMEEPDGASFRNENLGTINSWAFKLDVNTSKHGVSFFSNLIFDVPINSYSGLSGLNEIGQLPIVAFYGDTDAINYGAKAYTSFDLHGYKLHANYSIMYSNMDQNSDISMPLDFGNMFNLKLDRSFKFSEVKSLRVVASFHFRNGYQRLLIDEDESRERLQTTYNGISAKRLNNYQRLDLRISYIKKGKWKNVISLDIQNVMNRQNDAYYYFDPLLNEVQLQKQLGLIPILSWRIII